MKYQYLWIIAKYSYPWDPSMVCYIYPSEMSLIFLRFWDGSKDGIVADDELQTKLIWKWYSSFWLNISSHLIETNTHQLDMSSGGWNEHMSQDEEKPFSAEADWSRPMENTSQDIFWKQSQQKQTHCLKQLLYACIKCRFVIEVMANEWCYFVINHFHHSSNNQGIALPY